MRLGITIVLLMAVPAWPAPAGDADLEEAFADLEAVERLDALGYSGGYEPAPERTGVLVHKPGQVQPGVNLVLSAHRLGASVIGMEGTVIHEWAYDPWEALPPEEIPEPARAARQIGWDFWSRAEALPDGGLIFIQKGCGLFNIDRGSRLRWVRWLAAHHDFERLPDGRILCLAYVLDPGADTPRDDQIVIFGPDGTEERRISISRAILKSDFAPILLRYDDNPPYLHTNKLHVLDGAWAGRSPAFRRGNILLSCRNINTLIVLDPELQRVVWSLSGLWRRQHEPRPLSNGRLLLFDNLGNHGASRVLEFDPFTQVVHWRYEGRPRERFRSAVGGCCTRLSNGNTLITESTRGRVLEVTPAGETAWEYVNPHRSGSDERQVAPLFEARRLPEWPPAP